MGLTLADGVFDPLHAGHLAYLDACRQFGARVVVQVSPQVKRAECLPLTLREDIISRMGYWTVACPTTSAAIQVVRPDRYVKGADWRGKELPEAGVCHRLGVQVVYVDTPQDSSTGILERWAARTADEGLVEFEARAQAQVQIPFNAAAQGYTYEHRMAVEGEHPRILAELCRGKTVLDVGCGPGHLVRMLKDQGVKARGIDPYTTGEHVWDECYKATHVILCREVLEHLPVRELGAFVYHLFRVARERVYITTRFTSAPRHPFDLTTEFDADPSHITLLPQSTIRALCVLNGGIRDPEWEEKLDWQHKGRVLVYRVGHGQP